MNTNKSKIFAVFCIMYPAFCILLDVPKYTLPAPKKEVSVGKNSFLYLKRLLSNKNFPKLLEKISYLSSNEKSNILYLMLIFYNKFSKKKLRVWGKHIVKTNFVDNEFLHTVLVIFIQKKVCNKKILIKLHEWKIEANVVRKYNEVCK